MGYYDRSSLDLLCQQIIRDNPDIPYPLTPDNVVVLSGPFTTGLGSSGRNARITLNGRGGSGFSGKHEFFYDRLNIGSMFNGITVVFDAEGDSKTYADLLPALNEQYGLGLVAADLSNGGSKLSYGYQPTPVTLTIASTSPAYTGSLTVTWKRDPVGVYPDSGPGSKTLLVGTLDEGYFGTVSEAELFNPSAIFSKINEGWATPAGTFFSQSTLPFWYKFARDGKIVYLASANHLYIRWNELYVRGCLYETDQPLDKQFPPGPRTKQRLTMRKVEAGREWFLSPCAPRLSATFPWDYASPNNIPDPTGDIARLFVKVARSGDFGFATSEWDDLPYNGFSFWTSTTSAADPAKAYVSSMVGYFQAISDSATAVDGWRPMLELADLNKIAVPFVGFIGEPAGVLRKPMFSLTPDTSDVVLEITDVSWEVQGAMRLPLVTPTAKPPAMTENYYWDRGLQTPVCDYVAEPPNGIREISWNLPLRSPLVSIVTV